MLDFEAPTCAKHEPQPLQKDIVKEFEMKEQLAGLFGSYIQLLGNNEGVNSNMVQNDQTIRELNFKTYIVKFTALSPSEWRVV